PEPGRSGGYGSRADRRPPPRRIARAVRVAALRRRDGEPGGPRRENRNDRLQLVPQANGPDRPERVAPGGLRAALHRHAAARRDRRGPRTGQALWRRAVLAIRQRNPRPVDPRWGEEAGRNGGRAGGGIELIQERSKQPIFDFGFSILDLRSGHASA